MRYDNNSTGEKSSENLKDNIDLEDKNIASEDIPTYKRKREDFKNYLHWEPDKWLYMQKSFPKGKAKYEDDTPFTPGVFESNLPYKKRKHYKEPFSKTYETETDKIASPDSSKLPPTPGIEWIDTDQFFTKKINKEHQNAKSNFRE
jgi:hypothetical protein